MTHKNSVIDEKTQAPVSTRELAAMGGGKIAYVRALRGAELSRLFPQAPAMQPDQSMYLLLAADGAPLVIADSEQAAIANAWHNNLVTVSLH